MFSAGKSKGPESKILEPPEDRHHRLIFDWRNNSESSVHSSLVKTVPQGPGPPRDYCMVRVSPSHFADGSTRASGTIRIPLLSVAIHDNDEAKNRINVHQVLHLGVCEFAQTRPGRAASAPHQGSPGRSTERELETTTPRWKLEFSLAPPSRLGGSNFGPRRGSTRTGLNRARSGSTNYDSAGPDHHSPAPASPLD